MPAKESFKSLFEGKFKLITPIVWYNWFVSSFVYFGITFLLPLTLADIGLLSIYYNFSI